jgi:hypothetical protein
VIGRGDIFQTLGRISVHFSTLEGQLEESLCVLANEEAPMLAATLLGRSSFARNLELLENIAKFKGRIIEARVKRLLRVAKPLRKERNLFIHGRWDLSQLLDEGKVAVTDARVQHEESGRAGMRIMSWKKGTCHELTYNELREFETQVMRALKLARELLPAALLFHCEAVAQVQRAGERGPARGEAF